MAARYCPAFRRHLLVTSPMREPLQGTYQPLFILGKSCFWCSIYTPPIFIEFWAFLFFLTFWRNVYAAAYTAYRKLRPCGQIQTQLEMLQYKTTYVVFIISHANRRVYAKGSYLPLYSIAHRTICLSPFNICTCYWIMGHNSLLY